MKALLCALFLLRAATAQGLHPLESLSVQGTKIPKDSVQRLSGLKIGQIVDNAAFSAACKRLDDTGLFQSVSFEYAAGPKKIGYALVLKLSDRHDRTKARIDVPGVDEQEVWRWLRARDAVYTDEVPANDAAEAFYARAIELYLKQQGHPDHIIAQHFGGALGSGAGATITFQPETLPKVEALRFVGCQALPGETLQKALATTALHSEYTENRFRMLLAYNVQPLYEEHGHLNVRFPKVTMEKTSSQGVTVTTEVDEGATYNLGEVVIDGGDLPVQAMRDAANFGAGKLANWKEVSRSLEDLLKPLHRSGYLAASERSQRTLNDEQRTVNLSIRVEKGVRYSFGQLRFEGLDKDMEAKARKLWTLESGQPMNSEYPNEYVKSLYQDRQFRQFRRIASKFQKGAGANVMDVVISLQ